MTGTGIALLSLACTAAGVLLSTLGFRRKQKREDEQAGISRGTLLADVTYIKQSVDEIKEDNKNFRREIREEIAELSRRVTVLEVKWESAG